MILRARSMCELPSGFNEYEPPDVPDHLFSMMADAIPAARKLGAKSVELEESFNGVRAKMKIRIGGEQ